VEAPEARSQGVGGGLGLRVADALAGRARLARLHPQLARLAALAVGQRDDLGGAAVLDCLGDGAAGTPHEVGRVRADDLDSAAHAFAPARRPVLVTAIV